MNTKLIPDHNTFAQELFERLPRNYDLLVDLLTFGQNRRWRKQMTRRVAGRQLCLDVATGTAGAAIMIAKDGASKVVGIDLTSKMLAKGSQNIKAEGLEEKIALVSGRAESLPFKDSTFDALTFTYLLRYVADPAETLSELARVVKKGGPISSLEFYRPDNRLLMSLWWFYTRLILPLAGRLWGAEWFRVGRFLGPSISKHYARYGLEWQIKAWNAAGITDVAFKKMSLGGGLVMWGVRSSD